MGGKDTSYQIVYRGETLKHFKPGQCVFFQRERQYGGGIGWARHMWTVLSSCSNNQLL